MGTNPLVPKQRSGEQYFTYPQLADSIRSKFGSLDGFSDEELVEDYLRQKPEMRSRVKSVTEHRDAVRDFRTANGARDIDVVPTTTGEEMGRWVDQKKRQLQEGTMRRAAGAWDTLGTPESREAVGAVGATGGLALLNSGVRDAIGKSWKRGVDTHREIVDEDIPYDPTVQQTSGVGGFIENTAVGMVSNPELMLVPGIKAKGAVGGVIGAVKSAAKNAIVNSPLDAAAGVIAETLSSGDLGTITKPKNWSDEALYSAAFRLVGNLLGFARASSKLRSMPEAEVTALGALEAKRQDGTLTETDSQMMERISRALTGEPEAPVPMEGTPVPTEGTEGGPPIDRNRSGKPRYASPEELAAWKEAMAVEEGDPLKVAADLRETRRTTKELTDRTGEWIGTEREKALARRKRLKEMRWGDEPVADPTDPSEAENLMNRKRSLESMKVDKRGVGITPREGLDPLTDAEKAQLDRQSDPQYELPREQRLSRERPPADFDSFDNRDMVDDSPLFEDQTPSEVNNIYAAEPLLKETHEAHREAGMFYAKEAKSLKGDISKLQLEITELRPRVRQGREMIDALPENDPKRLEYRDHMREVEGMLEEKREALKEAELNLEEKNQLISQINDQMRSMRHRVTGAREAIANGGQLTDTTTALTKSLELEDAGKSVSVPEQLAAPSEIRKGTVNPAAARRAEARVSFSDETTPAKAQRVDQMPDVDARPREAFVEGPLEAVPGEIMRTDQPARSRRQVRGIQSRKKYEFQGLEFDASKYPDERTAMRALKEITDRYLEPEFTVPKNLGDERARLERATNKVEDRLRLHAEADRKLSQHVDDPVEYKRLKRNQLSPAALSHAEGLLAWQKHRRAQVELEIERREEARNKEAEVQAEYDLGPLPKDAGGLKAKRTAARSKLTKALNTMQDLDRLKKRKMQKGERETYKAKARRATDNLRRARAELKVIENAHAGLEGKETPVPKPIEEIAAEAVEASESLPRIKDAPLREPGKNPTEKPVSNDSLQTGYPSTRPFEGGGEGTPPPPGDGGGPSTPDPELPNPWVDHGPPNERPGYRGGLMEREMLRQARKSERYAIEHSPDEVVTPVAGRRGAKRSPVEKPAGTPGVDRLENAFRKTTTSTLEQLRRIGGTGQVLAEKFLNTEREGQMRSGTILYDLEGLAHLNSEQSSAVKGAMRDRSTIPALEPKLRRLAEKLAFWFDEQGKVMRDRRMKLQAERVFRSPKDGEIKKYTEIVPFEMRENFYPEKGDFVSKGKDGSYWKKGGGHSAGHVRDTDFLAKGHIAQEVFEYFTTTSEMIAENTNFNLDGANWDHIKNQLDVELAQSTLDPFDQEFVLDAFQKSMGDEVFVAEKWRSELQKDIRAWQVVTKLTTAAIGNYSQMRNTMDQYGTINSLKALEFMRKNPEQARRIAYRTFASLEGQLRHFASEADGIPGAAASAALNLTGMSKAEVVLRTNAAIAAPMWAEQTMVKLKSGKIKAEKGAWLKLTGQVSDADFARFKLKEAGVAPESIAAGKLTQTDLANVAWFGVKSTQFGGKPFEVPQFWETGFEGKGGPEAKTMTQFLGYQLKQFERDAQVIIREGAMRGNFKPLITMLVAGNALGEIVRWGQSFVMDVQTDMPYDEALGEFIDVLQHKRSGQEWIAKWPPALAMRIVENVTWIGGGGIVASLAEQGFYAAKQAPDAIPYIMGDEEAEKRMEERARSAARFPMGPTLMDLYRIPKMGVHVQKALFTGFFDQAGGKQEFAKAYDELKEVVKPVKVVERMGRKVGRHMGILEKLGRGLVTNDPATFNEGVRDYKKEWTEKILPR